MHLFLKNSNLSHDQKEMRENFLGGFTGQLVSGVIWLIASLVSVVSSPTLGMVVLFFGYMGIFPLTQLLLKLMSKNPKVS
jgi:hypothetical protein